MPVIHNILILGVQRCYNNPIEQISIAGHFATDRNSVLFALGGAISGSPSTRGDALNQNPEPCRWLRATIGLAMPC